jgi:hypothetical protein
MQQILFAFWQYLSKSMTIIYVLNNICDWVLRGSSEEHSEAMYGKSTDAKCGLSVVTS